MFGAPACGDVMRLQIQVNDLGIIEDAKFKICGSGLAIASLKTSTWPWCRMAKPCRMWIPLP